MSEKKYKIAIMGDKATGKTSLANRFLSDSFDAKYTPTIGMDFYSTKIYSTTQREEIACQIWDLSLGIFSESSPLKDAELFILVFDVTKQSSYDSLPKWIDEARELNPSGPIVLVANKSDRTDDLVINLDEIERFALEQNLEHVVLTSAKTSLNVRSLFKECANLLVSPRQMNDLKLQALVDKLKSDNPNNQHISAIAQTLEIGLKATVPQTYFNRLVSNTKSRTAQDNLKYHLDQLASTNKSLCNTVVNVVITVLLALSVVGLPLAYCFGILEQNQKTHGHSFMFFAFGEKQQGISVCNQVFAEMGVDCRM